MKPQVLNWSDNRNRRHHPLAAMLVVLLLATLLGGCVNKTVKRVNTTTAEHAEEEIPEAQLLNVNIAVFETGVVDPLADEEGVYPEVRKAEARYIPYQLRQTLQSTGQWGAVRVVPEAIASSELQITGKILESDGETLALQIVAVDAAGREWLNRRYEEEAAAISYSGQNRSEPFQDIYNRISNDLLKLRRAVSAADLENLRRLSEMRFAADLAPDAFGSFVQKKNGRYSLLGLPAQDDPNLARIEAIRQRDYAVIDALDQHYGVFQSRIDRPYSDWRAASYREKANLDELKGQAMTRMLLGAAAIAGGIYGVANADTAVEGLATQAAIIGGATLFKSGYDKNNEAKIHAEALKELGQSLESDLQPRVVELEGQTITLSGSAEAQYEEWRRLLKQIYAEETGFVEAATAD